MATVIGIYFAQNAVAKNFLGTKNEILQLRSAFDKRCDELESFCRRNEALMLVDDRFKTINIEVKGLNLHNEDNEQLQQESDTDFDNM
ncbi:hypothetical protein [Coleofasciculus sp. F4-SAH-05]|uniref:hypothetical protein n=1 Tax=Coleofasciculus sp. F4-SAH-05 TaxID=3069525 RepID=UPI0032F9EEE6